MTDVALPSASQCRFFPPPDARRSRKPTSSYGRQSPLQPPRLPPPPAGSPAKKLIVSTSVANSLRRQRPKARERFDRHPKSP